MSCVRPRAFALQLVFLAAVGCDVAPPLTELPDASQRDTGVVHGRVDGAPDAGSGDAGERAPAREAVASTGRLRGRVVSLGPATKTNVLVFRAGESKAIWKATTDREGRFVTPDLELGTYRVVLPGDGVHSTADLYASLGADADAGEIVIHRSKGCPIAVSVTGADGGAVSKATIELVLPDLEQVGDERVTVRSTTGDDGTAKILGTCVRGTITGTVTAPGAATPFEIKRGTMGNGRDRLAIALPGPAGETRAGEGDAAVPTSGAGP